jgi:hypothetical protein
MTLCTPACQTHNRADAEGRHLEPLGSPGIAGNDHRNGEAVHRVGVGEGPPPFQNRPSPLFSDGLSRAVMYLRLVQTMKEFASARLVDTPILNHSGSPRALP